ncbi:hypothetical protein GOBAR_AA11731 [Gossypium barbadense]|uniref:Uncharacterized protein n=1 Tax=Gossypium barbadense TaxID=3634 RepID=A0A2P5XZZ0_GOSBA|nr:hypothetical protein GOBAR_AA11731 [Gossypium barbadense]
MRSSGNSTVGNDSLLQWNSPLPYLFGGLTIVFGIIGIALLFLACSHWRQSSPELPNAKEEKNNETIQASASMEPKIVVIMAGDDHPRFVEIPSFISDDPYDTRKSFENVVPSSTPSKVMQIPKDSIYA